MNNNNTLTTKPSRILYTMLRIGNIEHSVEFYQNVLGMHELRRETFTKGRFTLIFLGYDSKSPNAMIELTYNWDAHNYVIGSGYGHIALEVTNIYEACKEFKEKGVNILLEPGPMTYAADETGKREVIAFIEDPDGYKIELVEVSKS